MNIILTKEICKHILANLQVFSSSFVGDKESTSILDKSNLLPEKLSFDIDGTNIKKNIYGCQVSVSEGKDFRILIGDCSQDNILEYALIVQLKDSPMFGVYYSEEDSESLIAVNTDGKSWIPCSTYLQATFLAGMEQIRDIGFGWTKCKSYQDQYRGMLSFIKFHSDFYGDNFEG